MTDWLTVQLVTWPADWLTDCAVGYMNEWRMTDGAIDWLCSWVPDCLTEWVIEQLTDWLCRWVPDQLTEWLIEQLTYWLCNWAPDCLTEWLIEQLNNWLCSWVPDWLTEWLIEQLTEWLTKLSNLPSYWLTATNWLTDLGTDCGLQSRGQFNKTFTSVGNLQVYSLFRVCVNHAPNKIMNFFTPFQWTSIFCFLIQRFLIIAIKSKESYTYANQTINTKQRNVPEKNLKK